MPFDLKSVGVLQLVCMRNKHEPALNYGTQALIGPSDMKFVGACGSCDRVVSES